MKSLIFKTLIFFLVIIFSALLLRLLTHTLKITDPLKKYPIRGIDISHYQTQIDWKKLKEEHISFIYIKATEGAYTVDDKFKEYWINAMKYNYKVGAYLFYIPNRPGKDQAAFFIQTVPNLRKALPPVVDLEFNIKNRSGKSKKQLISEINDCLIEITSHYNRKPLIYTNISFYHYFIKGNFDHYKLWIRDDSEEPRVDSDNWVIWQYTERGKVKGIKGNVDLNVLKGGFNELD